MVCRAGFRTGCERESGVKRKVFASLEVTLVNPQPVQNNLGSVIPNAFCISGSSGNEVCQVLPAKIVGCELEMQEWVWGERLEILLLIPGEE